MLAKYTLKWKRLFQKTSQNIFNRKERGQNIVSPSLPTKHNCIYFFSHFVAKQKQSQNCADTLFKILYCNKTPYRLQVPQSPTSQLGRRICYYPLEPRQRTENNGLLCSGRHLLKTSDVGKDTQDGKPSDEQK